MDLAGYPKDAIYYFKSQFLQDIPFIHIAPNSWETDPSYPNNKLPVAVYSNMDQIELFLNGQSLGKQVISTYDRANWTVSFKPGNLTAVGYRNGSSKVTTFDSIFTAGEPKSLVLSYDTSVTSGYSLFRADGLDVALVTATVLDQDGHVVRKGVNNDGLGVEVTFHVSGSGVLLGTGNGDPSDHTREGLLGSPTRRTWNGNVRAVVRSSQIAGEVVIQATAPGVQSASLTIWTSC